MKWYEIGAPVFILTVILYYVYKKTQKDGSTGSAPADGEQVYFTLSDIHSRGTPPPAELIPNAQKLLKEMNTLQRELYKLNPTYKLEFTSTYRSLAHNTSIGGATNSKHMQAKAADFKVQNLPAKEVQNLIVRLVFAGKMQNAGLGRGDTFTHYNYREDGLNSSWAYYHNGGADTYGVSFAVQRMANTISSTLLSEADQINAPEITSSNNAPAPTNYTLSINDLDI